MKNKIKQIDDFELFETNHRNLLYTNKTLKIREPNFLPKDLSEKDLRDTKLDQLSVSDFSGMFKKLNQTELLSCHKKLWRYDSNLTKKWKLTASFLISPKRSAIPG